MHIAQINISRAIASLDDPVMADFVRQLDALNAIGDASPGFVWRLKGDGGASSSYVRLTDDPRLLVNLTVWHSIEALREFTYGEAHAQVLRDRRRWFERHSAASFVLWWIEPGTIPTVDDGMERLRALDESGPTPYAFTFRETFPPTRASVP